MISKKNVLIKSLLLFLILHFIGITNIILASSGHHTFVPLPKGNDPRSLFEYTLNPGDNKIIDFAVLVNTENSEGNIIIYSNGFVKLPISEYFADNSKKDEMQKYDFIYLPNYSFLLKPYELIPVKFEIYIPEDIEPGQYTTELFAEFIPSESLKEYNSRLGKIITINITEDISQSEAKKYKENDWKKAMKDPLIFLQEKIIIICTFLIFIIISYIFSQILRKERKK